MITDIEIIERLGGVKAISKALGYRYSTVHNWTHRGISKDAKVEHPELFMPKSLDDLVPLTLPETQSEEA